MSRLKTPGLAPTATARTVKKITMLDEFDEIVGVDPSDPQGLIPLAVSLQPLECRIPQWIPGPSPTRTHILKLWWRIQGIDVEASSQSFTGPLNPADFPYSLYIPVDFMREIDAVVEVYYEVLAEDGTRIFSAPRTLTVDNNPPRFQHPDDKAQFVDPSIELTGITEAVLATHPFIEVLLTNYIGRAEGDLAGWYLDDDTPPFPSIQKGTQEFPTISEPLILRIPADDFRTLPNGTAYLQYRLYDRAGNFTVLSAPMNFQVNLMPSPVNLLPPEIRPPAYNDFLIKRDDARASVAAVIQNQYTGFAPGDSVVMIWDGRRVLPPQPITHFPFAVEIPWDVLRGTAPLALMEVPVQYEIHRPGRPPFPSPLRFIWVNLTIAGQDHVNAPALRNDTLPLVDVFGKGSGLHNELDFRDRELGAEVWVRLYQDPQPGERLELYWNGVGPVAHYVVQAGDVTDQPVQFTDVSGSVIVGGGNDPGIPVYYTTSNSVNEQHSPETLVNVHVAPLVKFDAPLIEHTLHGPARYLTCESKPSICHGVYWFILADSRYLPGDEIEFFWQGFLSNAWENPIDGTDFNSTVLLSADDIASGLSIRVWPWETKIEPMRNFASATAEFFVRRGGALIGDSVVGRVRIDRVSPGSGKICQPGDAGFCDGSLEGCNDNS